MDIRKLLHFNGNGSFNRKDVMDPIFKRKKRKGHKMAFCDSLKKYFRIKF